MNTDDCLTTVKIPGYDTVDVVHRVDPGTGHTRYRIIGHRVTGVVVLIPCYESDYVDPDTTRVIARFGDCAAGHAWRSDSERDHLPVCNSVALAGQPVIDLSRITPNERVTPHDLGIGRIWRASGDEAPEPTRHRITSVIAAIGDHWRSSPDNSAVRLAAARHAITTGSHLANKAAAMRDLGIEIAELMAEQHRNHAQYDRMKQLVQGHDDEVAADLA